MMAQKTILLLLVCSLFLSFCSAHSTVSEVRSAYLERGFVVQENHLLHEVMTHSAEPNSVVILPHEHVNLSWLWNELHQVHQLDGEPAEGYFDFLPALQSTLQLNGASSQWLGRCGWQFSASLTGNASSANLIVQIKESASSANHDAVRSSPSCSEFYDFGTREGGFLHEFLRTGEHRIEIASWRQYEYQDVQTRGLRVFLFPGSRSQTIASVAKTAELFNEVGPKQVQDNVDFLAQQMQWALQPRAAGLVALQEEDIQNGDYLAITRLDGLDPLIMFGTGGHTGHTAVALWFEDGLHICESTDAVGNHPYWPPPYGVIRTPFKQWVQQAMDAHYLVGVLRLAPQYRERFNNATAAEWFFKVQGMPYGWHNFIFTFMDTEFNNLPRPITPPLFEQVMALWERIIPIGDRGSLYNFLLQGLNHRFNSSCTDLHCMYGVIDPLKVNLEQATAIPEQDQWRYEGNYSMVCDVFVFRLYQNAGIFAAGLDIQATEQTPKDTYQMALFDTGEWRPQLCIDADPALPYCQLMGNYTLTLPGYNSIALYGSMNHACPSLPPVYARMPTNC